MLQIVREYAVERLAASGEAEQLRRRHAQHFLEFARLAEAELHGPNQGGWLERIELELDNLRAADAFWRETGDGESRLKAAVDLRRFWQLRGHLAEGLRMLEGALAEVPGADPPLRARALNSAGLLAAEQGDFESARTSLERALELGRELGQHAQVAATLSNLGNLAFFAGDSERARRLYRESLQTALALSDLRLQAVARENLAVLELDGERPSEAVGLLQEAVANARGSGDEHQLASSMRVLAAALLELRDLEAAADNLAESLGLARRLGDLITVAQALETAAGSSAAPEAERKQLLGAAANEYYKAKDYAKAAAVATRYFQYGGADKAVRTIYVQSLYLGGNYGAAAREIAANVEAEERAGKTPTEDELRLLGDAYLKSKDNAGYGRTIEKLVTNYPKRDYWQIAVYNVVTRSGFNDRLQIDVARLKFELGLLQKPDEYLDFAQLSLIEGFPAEANKVIDKGYAAGVLGTSG
jgi:Tfp pilus assembly protein PilF